MLKINLNKKDIIYIFSEEYEVEEIIKESRNIDGADLKFYTYKLKPSNEDTLHAEISVYSKENVFLKTTRNIDCDIKSRTIMYDGKIHQIFNEFEDANYNPRKDKIERTRVYELHDIKDRVINFDNPRRIVVKKNGDKILYDFQKIELTDIKKEKRESGEIERPAQTRKFIIKFKERPG